MKTFCSNLIIVTLAFFTPLMPVIILTTFMTILRIISSTWSSYIKNKKVSLKEILIIASWIIAYAITILGAGILDAVIALQYSTFANTISISVLAGVWICYEELKRIITDVQFITKINIMRFFKAIMKKQLDKLDINEIIHDEANTNKKD